MNTYSISARSLAAAVLSLTLTACASAPKLAAQDVLLKDIAPENVGLYASQEMRSSDDPLCQTFYGNTVDFVGRPTKTSSQEVLETVFLAALAGGATYGVGALGISNAFAALSLAASTNQVVYEGGKAALESSDAVATDLAPDVEIADAALRLGCPQPSKAALKLAVIQAKSNERSEKQLAKLRKTKLADKDVVCREDVQNC